MGLLSPLICNEVPLLLKAENKWSLPIFYKWTTGILPKNCTVIFKNNEWQYQNAQYIILPPITYSAFVYDYNNAPFVSPFQYQSNAQIKELPMRYRHWFGTGKKGEDILACCIYGLGYSFFICGFSTLIASLFGLSIGVAASYYGNHYFKMSWLQYLGIAMGLGSASYISLHLLPLLYNTNTALLTLSFITICLIVIFIFNTVSRWMHLKKNLPFPIEKILTTSINIFSSIPALVLIITCIALLKPSVSTLIIMLALTGWPTLARIAFTETKQLQQLPYLQSAKAMGYSSYYIITKELLPNFTYVFITTTLYVGAALLIAESSLTFLGLGTPFPLVTLGSILSQFKENYLAWWVALFPLLVLFILLYCLHTLAKKPQS